MPNCGRKVFLQLRLSKRTRAVGWVCFNPACGQKTGFRNCVITTDKFVVSFNNALYLFGYPTMAQEAYSRDK